MTCPTCGARSRILDSRDLEVYVKRRRCCLGCGQRWSTVEVRLAHRATRTQVGTVVEAAYQNGVAGPARPPTPS